MVAMGLGLTWSCEGAKESPHGTTESTQSTQPTQLTASPPAHPPAGEVCLIVGRIDPETSFTTATGRWVAQIEGSGACASTQTAP